MSHLGLHILYNLINEEEGLFAKECLLLDGYEEEMIREEIPLFTLESKEPVKILIFRLHFTI